MIARGGCMGVNDAIAVNNDIIPMGINHEQASAMAAV